MLRAFSTADGHPLWQYNTQQEVKTVNGVAAKGGSMGAPGPTVAGGMLFVGSDTHSVLAQLVTYYWRFPLNNREQCCRLRMVCQSNDVGCGYSHHRAIWSGRSFPKRTSPWVWLPGLQSNWQPSVTSRDYAGWSFNAPADFRTKPREVLCVPGIDGLRLCLERAMREKGVVNGAAGDAERRGRLKCLEIFLVVETYDRQPLPYISEKQHRFISADALPAGPPGE